MMNVMEIDGYRAVIQFDPDIRMFRGEFTALNGGADFYSDSVTGLDLEGRTSLRMFLDVCRERGITPRKDFSGKFMVRLPGELHARAVEVAAARGVSLNTLIQDSLSGALADAWTSSAADMASGPVVERHAVADGHTIDAIAFADNDEVVDVTEATERAVVGQTARVIEDVSFPGRPTGPKSSATPIPLRRRK